jgi:hypothetical protein
MKFVCGNLCFALLMALAGCGSLDINQFAAGKPTMAPQDWMTGTVDGYGFIIDRFGNVQSQFHAHEVGNWNPSTQSITLTEKITYLQNSRAKPTFRIWHFTQVAPGEWTGTASDVIGTAKATQQGNAWHLVYRQFLPVHGHQVAVTVDDWRIREDERVALDRATISKLGLCLATSEIAFVKSD